MMKRIKWGKMGKIHTSVYSFGPLVADQEHSNKRRERERGREREGESGGTTTTIIIIYTARQNLKQG